MKYLVRVAAITVLIGAVACSTPQAPSIYNQAERSITSAEAEALAEDRPRMLREAREEMEKARQALAQRDTNRAELHASIALARYQAAQDLTRRDRAERLADRVESNREALQGAPAPQRAWRMSAEPGRAWRMPAESRAVEEEEAPEVREEATWGPRPDVEDEAPVREEAPRVVDDGDRDLAEGALVQASLARARALGSYYDEQCQGPFREFDATIDIAEDRFERGDYGRTYEIANEAVERLRRCEGQAAPMEVEPPVEIDEIEEPVEEVDEPVEEAEETGEVSRELEEARAALAAAEEARREALEERDEARAQLEQVHREGAADEEVDEAVREQVRAAEERRRQAEQEARQAQAAQRSAEAEARRSQQAQQRAEGQAQRAAGSQRSAEERARRAEGQARESRAQAQQQAREAQQQARAQTPEREEREAPRREMAEAPSDLPSEARIEAVEAVSAARILRDENEAHRDSSVYRTGESLLSQATEALDDGRHREAEMVARQAGRAFEVAGADTEELQEIEESLAEEEQEVEDADEVEEVEEMEEEEAGEGDEEVEEVDEEVEEIEDLEESGEENGARWEVEDAMSDAHRAMERCIAAQCELRDRDRWAAIRQRQNEAYRLSEAEDWEAALANFEEVQRETEALREVTLPFTVPNNVSRVRHQGNRLVLSPRILFGTASAEVTADSVDSIEELAQTITANLESLRLVRVVGYTDSRGSVERNMELSADRANTVRRRLVQLGVPSDLVSATGRGPEDPIADNDTAQGRELNRRVEIEIDVR